MTKEIVLIHGAFAGPWCMEDYARFLSRPGLDGAHTRRCAIMVATPRPSLIRA